MLVRRRHPEQGRRPKLQVPTELGLCWDHRGRRTRQVSKTLPRTEPCSAMQAGVMPSIGVQPQGLSSVPHLGPASDLTVRFLVYIFIYHIKFILIRSLNSKFD